MENFYITRKIYYYHTDAGGVVYYGRYLEFFEEGRTEYGSMLKLVETI